VNGLTMWIRGEWRSLSEWKLVFNYSVSSLYISLGTYPSVSLDEARELARAKLAVYEQEMQPLIDEDCAAYDLALMRLKSGDGTAQTDVRRGFARIAQVPFDAAETIRVDWRDLPSSAGLLIKVADLEYDHTTQVRVVNTLKNDNVITVAHLLLKSDGEFLRTPNFGRKSLNVVKTALARVLAEAEVKIDPRAGNCGMTLDEAIHIIFDEAQHQGEPLTMDVCRHIATRLLFPHQSTLKPGEIAQKHRERYQED
jgi:Bacterial RNA polymerase, alpha chain C terminal domain